MLDAGHKMFAYRFKGYWKDVGTEESLWQANMDLLDDLHLGFENWPILSRTAGRPPHYIAPSGSIKNTLITEGCEIYGSVENSILSAGVIVEEGATVRDSVIMEDARICKNAIVNYAILDDNTVIGENVVVGKPREQAGNVTVTAHNSMIFERGKTK
jgi:glucose-1-phosphate adenylyltransferase